MYSMFQQHFFRFVRLISAVVLISVAGSPGAFATERMIVVLDGSGSMWGQIDGKPKLEIARETLSEVLKGVDEETELGLLAYGHREKGNCSDIELIVPPAAGTRSQIIDAVNNLKFLGKTPLTAAVKQAAEELRYTEDRATVILITDGLETCNANVCDVANQLETEGVDFTAHVVGFGLSEVQGRKVACLAENTGGRYFQADDAAGLVAALKETITAPVVPEIQLVAVDQDDQLIEDIGLAWKLLDAKGEVLLEEVSKAGVSIALPLGDYKVMVRGEGASGGREFSVTEDAQQKIDVPVELQKLQASLEAPAEVAAGAQFEVSWSGPDNKRDFVTIVETDAEPNEYGSYQYTKTGTPITLTAPDGLGEYEIRYVLGDSKQTLATRKIVLTEIEASLDVPAEVAAGSEFEVVWTGPDNKRDFITIVESGADEGKYGSYKYTRTGSPIKLTAPDGLGEYEIRYVLAGSKRTLVSRKLVLTELQASLDVPAEVAAGSEFEVVWAGPDNKRDFITIVESGADEGKYGGYKYTRKGSPIKLTAPDGLGEYEIRYVLGESKRTLVSRKLVLTEIQASLDAPSEVAAGSEFEVVWTGPDNKRDFITVVESGAQEGKYGGYKYTRSSSPIKLTAPDGLGEYEIRYVLGGSKRTLVSRKIILSAVEASLTVPETVSPEGKLTIEWTGPDNKGDFITLVEKGTPEGKYAVYRRTDRGNPITLKVPKALGLFEVRYVVGSSKRTLASADVQLKVASATLAIVNPVKAGGVIEVNWTGPANQNDFIEVVAIDAADKDNPISAARTAQGSPLQLFAPASAGEYRVRYKMRDNNEVIASEALIVE